MKVRGSIEFGSRNAEFGKKEDGGRKKGLDAGKLGSYIFFAL